MGSFNPCSYVLAAHTVRAAPRHLAVSGVTPRVERDCTHTKDSGRLKLAIFLRKGRIPPSIQSQALACFGRTIASYEKASGGYNTSMPGSGVLTSGRSCKGSFIRASCWWSFNERV